MRSSAQSMCTGDGLVAIGVGRNGPTTGGNVGADELIGHGTLLTAGYVQSRELNRTRIRERMSRVTGPP